MKETEKDQQEISSNKASGARKLRECSSVRRKNKYAQILGTILPDQEDVLSGSYRVLARKMDDKSLIGDVKADISGRFLFKWHPDESACPSGYAVELIAIDTANRVVGSRRTMMPRSSEVRKEEIVIKVHRPIRYTHSSSRTRARNDMLVAQLRLAALAFQPYNLVHLNRLLESIAPSEKAIKVPQWVNQSIRDLNEASQLTSEFLFSGSTNVDRLMSLLSRPFLQTPTPIFLADQTHIVKLDGQMLSFPPCELMRPRKMCQIVYTELAIELGQGKVGKDFVSRAKTFVSHRITPLENLYAGAMRVSNGSIDVDRFTNWLGSGSIKDPLEELVTLETFMPDICPDPAPDPEKPDWEKELDKIWAIIFEECLYSLKRKKKDDKVRVTTEDIGSISPSVSCACEEVTIEIRPRDGATFLDSPPPAIKLMYANGGSKYQCDQIELDPIDWQHNLIRVNLPAGLHTGRVYFEYKGSPPVRLEVCKLLSFYTGVPEFSEPLLPLPPPEGPRPSWAVEVDDGPNRVELVQAPVIASFTAKGESNTLEARACASVMIEWEINFGDGTYKIADKVSLERIQVALFNGDILISDSFGCTGQETRKDREDCHFRVRAEAKIDDNACGADEANLTISRYRDLRSLLNVSRIGTGKHIMLTVDRPCALNSPLDVQISTTNDSLFQDLPSEMRIESDNTQVSQSLAIANTGCGDVEIRADATDYQRGTVNLYVFDKPKITSVDPRWVDGCSSFDIEIAGVCFNKSPDSNKPFLECNSVEFPLDVKACEGNTLICHREDGLVPGTYNVYVRHNDDYISEPAPRTLKVRNVVPNIEVFSIKRVDEEVDLTKIAPCNNTKVRVSWRVWNASLVRVKYKEKSKLNWEEILSKSSENCGLIKDPEDLPDFEINEKTTFVIEAHPLGGGDKVSKEKIVKEIPVTKMSSITFEYTTGNQFVVWIFDKDMKHPRKVGKLNQNDSLLTYYLSDCFYFYYRIVDVEEVEAYNNASSTTDLDPYGSEAAKEKNLCINFNNDLFLGKSGEGNYKVYVGGTAVS